MRWFLTGIIVFIILAVGAWFLKDWSILIDISGIVGVSALLLAAVLSGALVTGDRIRANYSKNDGDKSENHERKQMARALLLIGLPNVAGSFVIYLLTK